MDCIDDNFLTQVIKKLMRADALLDMILTNKEETIRDVKAESSLGCGDRGMVESGS